MSTTSFGLGAKYFAFYEIEGVGVQWDNMSVSPVEDDEYSLRLVMLMMTFDALLYALLTWYIEHVHPGIIHSLSQRIASVLNNDSSESYKLINQDTTKHFLTFDVSVSNTRDLPQKKFVYFLSRFLPR